MVSFVLDKDERERLVCTEWKMYRGHRHSGSEAFVQRHFTRQKGKKGVQSSVEFVKPGGFGLEKKAFHASDGCNNNILKKRKFIFK